MATIFSQPWQTASRTLPIAKTNGWLLSHGNRLYHVGGPSATLTLGTQEIYSAVVHADGSIDPWVTVGILPRGLGFIHAVVHADRMYVLGGFNTSGGTQNTVYSIRLGASGPVGDWKTDSTPLPLGTYRSPGGVVVVGDYLYAISGATASATTATCWSAKLAGGLGPWQQLTSVPVGVQAPMVLHHNGWIYLMGGSTNGASANNKATVYSAPVTPGGGLGAWSLVSSMPQPIDRMAAAVVNGTHLAVIGGRASAGTNLGTVYVAALGTGGQLGPWVLDDFPLVTAERNISATELAGRIWIASGFTSAREANVYSVKL